MLYQPFQNERVFYLPKKRHPSEAPIQQPLTNYSSVLDCRLTTRHKIR
jgi:hypothetical protein